MSATNLVQSATRHYPIEDAWFEEFANDPNAYVDIMEIRQNPTQSAYLQWLIANVAGRSYSQEQQRASFIDNGIRVGDCDSGDHLRGFMKDEDYIANNKYSAGTNHSERWKRFYAQGTTARGIWFVGFGSKTYDNTDFSTINAAGVVQ